MKEVMSAQDAPDTLSAAFAHFIRHPNIYCFGLAGSAAFVARVYQGQWSWVDAAIIAFIVSAWPFMEWRLHIKLLHMKPRVRNGKEVYPSVARKHRDHHLEPWRLDLVFLQKEILLAIPLVFVVANILFPFHYALTVCFTGYLMTVNYEWNHFITHTRVQAKTSWYRKMFLHHRLHHFKNERYWYGFSAPWPDQIYGTMRDPKDVENSENCRNLGVSLKGEGKA